MLSNGVFATVNANSITQRVPLAVAEVTRTVAGLRLRWPDGKKSRSLTVNCAAALADAVEQVAAFWWHQPLFLLPLAALPFRSERVGTRYFLMLSGEQLWLLTPAQAPHPIPLAAVHDIADAGVQTAVITTHDSNFPDIRVNRYQSSDLLRQLKRYVAK